MENCMTETIAWKEHFCRACVSGVHVIPDTEENFYMFRGSLCSPLVEDMSYARVSAVVNAPFPLPQTPHVQQVQQHETRTRLQQQDHSVFTTD